MPRQRHHSGEWDVAGQSGTLDVARMQEAERRILDEMKQELAGYGTAGDVIIHEVVDHIKLGDLAAAVASKNSAHARHAVHEMLYGLKTGLAKIAQILERADAITSGLEAAVEAASAEAEAARVAASNAHAVATKGQEVRD